MNKRLCIFITMISLFFVSFIHTFQTLKDLQQYAQSMPEYPDSDNQNWLNPDYTSFYTRHTPSIFSSLLQFIGFQKPLWSIKQFKSLLEKLVALREKTGYIGRFIHKITPTPGTRFFMWGDLHGSFHSLVRELTYLKKEGIIDENLTIIAKDCFFVFNGNVIDLSAYTLETLSVVMLLLHQNPDKVVYLRGDHEDKQKWYNYDLKNAIMTYGRTISSEKIPLNNLLSRFFNTLPLALYIISDAHKEYVTAVRVSYQGRTADELDESHFTAFLTTPQAQTNKLSAAFNLDSNEQPIAKREKEYKSIEIKAIIKGEDRSISFTPTNGLTGLIPDKGAQAWSLLSAQNNTYRRIYSFFNDAFAVLKIQDSIKEWTISLYAQDVRELLGIKKIEAYYITSGISIYTQKSIKEINKTEPIMLGSSMDLTRTKILSERFRDGIYSYFSMINKLGGISNRLINFTILNDNYRPSLSRKNIEQFLQSNISIILSPTGSPTTQAYLDLVRKKKVLVLFPPTGAPIFRQPDLTNMINFRPSYAAEAYALVEHAATKLRAHNMVFFYQNDAFGLGGLYGARLAAKDFNVSDILEVPYSRNDVSFTRQVELIKDKNPNAIFFFATPDASRQFLLQMDTRYLTSVKLMGISDWGPDIFKNFIKYKGLDYIITNVVPNPKTSDIAIVREFRERAKKGALRVDPVTLEGYINAALTVKLLTMSNGDDSHEVLVSKAESIKHEKFEGLRLNFDPKTRELSHSLWIDTGDDEWIEYQAKDLDLTKISSTVKKSVKKDEVKESKAKEDHKNNSEKDKTPQEVSPSTETVNEK